jgi:hypothetical protein
MDEMLGTSEKEENDGSKGSQEGLVAGDVENRSRIVSQFADQEENRSTHSLSTKSPPADNTVSNGPLSSHLVTTYCLSLSPSTPPSLFVWFPSTGEGLSLTSWISGSSLALR